MAKLSETAETEHFADANTSHILRHWKDNTTVRLYNLKKNFIPTDYTGHSTTKTAMDRNQQTCHGENVFVSKVQISVDFKTIDPKIT